MILSDKTIKELISKNELVIDPLNEKTRFNQPQLTVELARII